MDGMPLKNKWFWLLPIIGVISFWSFATPIFEFPDEQAHLESVEFIAKEGRKPRLSEFDMTKEMQDTQEYLGTLRDKLGNNKLTYHPEYHVKYSSGLIGENELAIKSLNTEELRSNYVAKEAADYPRLYYDYVGLWDKLFWGSDIFIRATIMRVSNILLAALTAYVVYKIGLLVFASAPRARTLALLVMLQPMYSFLSAGVNSDNLHNLLFSIIILLGLQIIKSGMNLKTFSLSLFVVWLDMITKPQGYIAVPILITAYLIKIVSDRKWKQLAYIVAGGLAFTTLIMSPINPYLDWINKPNIHNANLVEFLRFSLNKLVAQNIVWYWGVFKWLGVVLPPMYWQVANRLVMFSGLGLILYFWKSFKHKKIVTSSPFTIFLILSTVIYVGAIYYFDWQYNKAVGYSLGVQARYFFPTISAQMSLLMIGILSFGHNKIVRTWLRKGLVVFIVWMQLGGIWRLLGSYYDLSNFNNFMTQISQYKPDFLKGDWWYLWILIYLSSVGAILINHMPPRSNPKIRQSKGKLDK